jgi:3',5'-cyclic AMP phosphodiesterase CpdA
MDISRIWHVSDLHERSDPEHNRTVRDKLAAIPFDPAGDLLIVTGDLTDDGKEAQYAEALEHLRPFAGRVVICPGNHDYGPMGNLYERAAVARFDKLRAALGAHKALDGGGVRVLALDTCLRTASPFDFARGRVGWWQGKRIGWFCAACHRAGVHSVIAMHHTPFIPPPNPADWAWCVRLADADRLFKVAEGNASLVLVGHEHKERHVQMKQQGDRSDRTTWISAPSLAQHAAEPIKIVPAIDLACPRRTP